MMLTTIGHDAQRIVSLSAAILSPRRLRWCSSIVIALLALGFASVLPVFAASINYGDQPGATVTFLQVTESSITDPVPLFGAPTPSGDSLDFTPTSFGAVSQLHVPAVDQTDGHLTFGVVPKFPGGAIQNIKFAEGGGLTVGGFGTNQTFVDVSAVGNLDIFAIDDVPISKVTIPIKLTFSYGNNAPFNDNGTWRLGSQGFVNGSWTGEQFIDINQILTDKGYSFARGATWIEVAIDNKLYAQSEIEGTAQIDKKDFFTVTTNIPEPASCLLAIFGFVAAGCVARRSR